MKYCSVPLGVFCASLGSPLGASWSIPGGRQAPRWLVLMFSAPLAYKKVMVLTFVCSLRHRMVFQWKPEIALSVL